MGYFKTLHRAAKESVNRTRRKVPKNVGRVAHMVRKHVCAAPRRLGSYIAGTVQYYRHNLGSLRQELVCGFAVTIMQIPESLAFSFVAGVDPIIGLRASIVMGIVCGLLCTRPGMVSGIDGAISVTLGQLSGSGGKWSNRPKSEVEQLVYMTIILTGAIEFGVSASGLARLSKMIPFTAMIGFMNGVAIIIWISQLNTFKECPGSEYSVCARANTLQWQSVEEGETWMTILETLMATIIVAVFPIWKKASRYIPPTLVALVLVTSFEHGINRTLIHLPTRTVKETADVEGKFIAPSIPQLPNDTPWGDMAAYASILAVMGLVESIMTSDVVAELQHDRNGPLASTQDVFAQGIGNLVSGLLGSIGGDAMPGQSVVNILNGAHHRLSAVSGGVYLAILILALPGAVGVIPVACLTGILIVIAFQTFHWNSFILLFQLSWMDSLNIVLVTVLAVVTNLAIAVAAGIVWRALVHAFAASSLLHVHTELFGPGGERITEEGEGETERDVEKREDTPGSVAPDAGSTAGLTKVYHVHGPLFFGSAASFRMAFTPAADPQQTVVDLQQALVSDFSGVAAIRAVCKRYKQLHKTVVVRGLNAPANSHILRHPKLRPFMIGDEHVVVSNVPPGRDGERATAGDASPAFTQQHEQEEEQSEAPAYLRPFQPQGDELHHLEVELTASQARDELLAAGIQVEDDHGLSEETRQWHATDDDADDDADTATRHSRHCGPHHFYHKSTTSFV